jgi:hypothetical protein
MAETAEVRKKIDRILDETRQVRRGLTCSAMGGADSVQPSPGLHGFGNATGPTTGACAVALQMPSLTAQAVSVIERRLLTEPDDLEARGQLIANYYLTGVQHPRLDHIFWLIEHHPEASLAAFNSAAILPGNTAMNSAADYAKAASLWRRQTAIHSADATVLGNAAQFLRSPAATLTKRNGCCTVRTSNAPLHSPAIHSWRRYSRWAGTFSAVRRPLTPPGTNRGAGERVPSAHCARRGCEPAAPA